MPRCCRCGASDYSMAHSCPFDASLQCTQVTPIRPSPGRGPFVPPGQTYRRAYSPEHSSNGTDDSFLPSETSCLQDLLRHTCSYAQKMEERIAERVHCADKTVGDSVPSFCPELEKDLLFTEMTSKTTDYYQGMIRDRMSTRRYTLDKTEQDMWHGFNRVIYILRKMEKADEFCDVISELQNVRAQVKVLTVAAERYGATTSEIRFLNDLEKVIRCIECIDKHHVQTSCELNKLRMMNDELCNLASENRLTDSAVQCFLQDVCQSPREQKSTSPPPPCTSSVACQAAFRPPSPPQPCPPPCLLPCPPPCPPASSSPPEMPRSMDPFISPYLGEVYSMAECETASFVQSQGSKEQVCGNASQGSLICFPPRPQARSSTPICSTLLPRMRGRDEMRQEDYTTHDVSPHLRQRTQRTSRSVDDYQTVCTEISPPPPPEVCPEPSATTMTEETSPPCPFDRIDVKSMDLLERLFYIGLLLLGAAALLFLAFHLFALWQRLQTPQEDRDALCEPCSPTCLDEMDCYCRRETPPPPEDPTTDAEEPSTDQFCGPACHVFNFFHNVHNMI